MDLGWWKCYIMITVFNVYFPNQCPIAFFCGVFHREMKIHGMNGKVIVLLENPPD